jgi:vacuolar-type H+-ATPase subunit E/Vma4
MIRSPAALRRRFDQIAAQADRKPNKKISHVEDSFPNEAEQARQLAEYEAQAAHRLQTTTKEN